MWIVRLALRRPYTFVVLAMLILLMGALTLARMPTDIFPQIDIPVVAAVWTYTGLPPQEMEGRITSQFERAATTTVSGIEHIESQSLAGFAVIKIFLQPGTSLDGAVAEVGAISETILKQLPPAATPPLILRYSASDTSVVQLGLSSETLNEQEIYDLATNFVRPGLATVRGAQMPLPVGGKVRQIVVDLDLEKLYAWGLSPADVSAAVNVQNLILPSGTAKLGKQEYPILVNSSPSIVDAFNALPVKTIGGTTVYLRDVAHVRDGYAPQTSVVVADGTKGALLPVLKSRGASTLEVVAGVREALPRVLSTVSKDLAVEPLFDQSVFVRGAIDGVVREAAIAAGLTGLMMLLFLGSWRSTVIVLVSIPLSLLVSLIVLDRLGQTINLMTLGGLALAVGILVDDATVEIENFHRNRAMNKPIIQAILDGAAEIAAPAFVSTLCICIVFVPVSFISGAARSLFVPLAMAIVFAMLTSYFLSRTLVPTMEHFLLAKESPDARGRGPIARVHRGIERGFERLRNAYERALLAALAHRRAFVIGFLAVAGASLTLALFLGQNFFPSVDAGQMRLHVRASPGTRIEETQRLFADVEEHVRRIVPSSELAMILDDIGEPVSGINLALGDPSMISAADGEMLIELAPKHHATAGYVRTLRRDLSAAFPDSVFFFLPADISTQVLDFGLSAPIDIRLAGPPRNQAQNAAIGRELVRRVAAVPGAVDVHMAQVTETPELLVSIDRTLASQVGLTTQQVASDVLVSLSSSGQTAPNFWLDPKNGVQYLVAVQTPQYRVDSIDALQATPLTISAASGQPQLLANVAGVSRLTGPTNVTHYNVGPTIDVVANVDGTDLGSVSAAVRRIVSETRARLPRGTGISVEGQPASMRASFLGLGFGLAFAVVLVYALMVVNFQSWLDPFIILMALPGALAGIVWMLFLTHTPLSVPALMGSLMTVGVATANSILVVMFANDARREGHDAEAAALAAGRTRLRPVMMTAIAMILGMLPMSLGLGDGGEQNAPLGRAVIGGLLFATGSTLVFVPVMYAILRRHGPRRNQAAGERS
jgi:multidrug efflux pump subunit AcrB